MGDKEDQAKDPGRPLRKPRPRSCHQLALPSVTDLNTKFISHLLNSLGNIHLPLPPFLIVDSQGFQKL